MPLKLGISGWRLRGQRTGVGRYLANVVKHWGEQPGRFDEITLYTPQRVDRREVPLPGGVRERIIASRWPMLLWENLLLPWAARDDVLFCPSYARPLLAPRRTVVTTHDAVLHLHPELFAFSARVFYDRLYGWSARHATLVLTSSEAARQDIARCYGTPLSRIRVAYLAPAEAFRPQPAGAGAGDAVVRLLGSDAPFFLFVGKMSGRRSIPLLLEAFAEFRRRSSFAHKLLLVGPRPESLDLASLAGRLGIAEHVVHRGYVSDDELALLYNAAQAFVSPSIYETVSLPVLEAQASGTPVVCVDSDGMREITGGAALLMKRTDVRELSAALLRLAGEAALRAELRERGLEHAKRFSWRRCAAETMAALEEAAGLPPRPQAA